MYKRQAAQRVDADAEFRGHLPAGPPLLGDHPHCPRLEAVSYTHLMADAVLEGRQGEQMDEAEAEEEVAAAE